MKANVLGTWSMRACVLTFLPKNVPQVNLPSSFDFFELKKQAADDNFFGQLLCITKSSSPKLSDEYSGQYNARLGTPFI